MNGNTVAMQDNVKKFIRMAYSDPQLKQYLADIVSDTYKSEKVPHYLVSSVV